MRNVKLVTRPAMGMPADSGTMWVAIVDADHGHLIDGGRVNRDPILARASAIELATSRGWHIVSKDWDR